jgi:putative membrane protein
MDSGYVVLQSLIAGFPVLLLHFSVALSLWLASTVIYFYLTPLKKLEMIKQGNVAVGIVGSSVCISLGLPLAFCLSGSINVWDIVIWSIPVLLIQILIFMVMRAFIQDLPAKIAGGNIALALLVASVRLTSAILLSAAILD